MADPVHTGSSYLDLGISSPMAIGELMPGVTNLYDWVGLRGGEQVLLLVDHTADPLVIQALAAAAAVREAEVHVLSVPPFVPGGWRGVGPSAIVTAAYAESDVVVSCVWQAEVQTRELFFYEAAKHRARFLSMQMTATASMLTTGARFPLGLYYRILERAKAIFADVRELRVTTRKGTDLVFHDPTFVPEPGPLSRGMWRPFPYGGLNFYNDRTEGVFVVEESNVTGVPEEPLRVTVHDGSVTDIAGGAAADHLRAFGPMGFYMRHFYVGLNPKVRLMGAPMFERTKHAGAFYLGIDGLTDGQPDRHQPGYAHCDCQFDRPTVSVDGRVVIDSGRLLELREPGLREEAAEFGDPDVLLDDNPLLVLRPSQWGRPS